MTDTNDSTQRKPFRDPALGSEYGEQQAVKDFLEKARKLEKEAEERLRQSSEEENQSGGGNKERG